MLRPSSVNVWEVAGGVCFLLIGITVTWIGSEYPLGSLQRLGAGAFPVASGVTMAGFGIAIILAGLKAGTPPPEVSLRAFLSIPLGMLAWAVVAPRYGLIPATVCLVVICSFAQRPVRPLTMLMVAVVLSIAGTVVFLKGFGIPLAAIGR